VLIEEQFNGGDYRLLVVGGKLIAAALRMPAHVVGDGSKCIGDLIELSNRDPRRGSGHEAALTKIAIGPGLVHFIARRGLSLASVPKYGQHVPLSPAANLSTGGTAKDCTDIVHPDNELIACRAAEIVGLDVAGIDVVTPDISRSVFETGGGIVEVNAGPGFRMHFHPSEGKARNVAAPVIDLLYPNNETSRIPVISITGTNGKTTTARMVAHILKAHGLKVGLSSSTGVYIGGKRVTKGDCTGPRSARIVLDDPTVDVAVLETARGGLLREGLAFSECDIGCVTNVTSDHLGMRGIETIDDLAAVKSVIIENVHREGWSVLNGDNDHTLAMKVTARGSLCFFTTKPPEQWPEELTEHVSSGGTVITCDISSSDKQVTLIKECQELGVMRVDEIPATFGGFALPNVENALAAIAITFCNGVPLPLIRESLSNFNTTFEQSPGRLNLLDKGKFKTIVDYAHNADGLRSLGGLIKKLKGDSSSIGVITIAGDRRDQDIIEMGLLAGTIFDRLIFKEDVDLRGRAPGEVAALLHQGSIIAGKSHDLVEIVLNERDAIVHAVNTAGVGDVVLITADDIEAVWKFVSEYIPEEPHFPLPVRDSGDIQSGARVL